MGHIWFGSVFDYYIHAFHMPMWFILSGYFFDAKKNTKYYILKKMKELLAPYIFFALMYELLWTFMGNSQWSGIIWPNTVQVPLNGALWFLPAMFVVNVVSFLLLKYTPWVIAVIIITIISFAGSLHVVSLPFSADSAMVGIGFFLIGHLLRKYGAKVLKLKIGYSVIGFILNTILKFINGYVNVRLNQYANIVLFWVNAVVGTVVFWNIARWMEHKATLSIFQEIGRQSLLYVCLNQFIIALLSYVPISGGIAAVVWKVMEVWIVITVCFWLNRLLAKTPFKK